MIVPRLAVDSEGLVFGRPDSRHGARLRFAPEGAVVEGIEVPRRLAWERALDPVDIWSDGYPVVYGDHWAISGPVRFEGTAIRVGDESFRVTSFSFDGVTGSSEVAAASALCAYLRDVPAARNGLAEHEVISRISECLDRYEWLSRNHTPLAGAAFDVTRHLMRAIRGFGMHCYLGRLVEGEVVPPVSEVVDAVRAGLPHFVNGKATSPDAIARRYERIRSQPPWPFAVLTSRA